MNNTALVIIDVQRGMFETPPGMPPVYGGEALLEKLNQLIGQARAAQVPVIYVQHNGSNGHLLEPGSAGWPIHPAIQPGPGDLVVQKREPDAFYETTLQAELEARQVKKLVIAGIQTEYCVDTTCRRAFSLGYEVTLAKDAHSTWDNEGLTAAQIIAHHNLTLERGFVAAKASEEISFS